MKELPPLTSYSEDQRQKAMNKFRIGETVVIRYDPRDIAEIRVFFKDKYLCTAITPEISDYTVDLKDIISARNKIRRSRKSTGILLVYLCSLLLVL